MDIKPSSEQSPLQVLLPTNSDLAPEDRVIREPFNDGAAIGQRFYLLSNLPLLLATVLNDRRTEGGQLPIRTPRRAAGQQDHRDCEDGGSPPPTSAVVHD